MSPRFESDVVALLRMGQGNAVHHLVPLARSIAPRTLWVFRPEHAPLNIQEPNIRYITRRQRFRLAAVLRTIAAAYAQTRRNTTGAIVSFNAYPYGLAAVAISRLTGKPCHVGFVGSDLRLAAKHPNLARMTNGADLITVTGNGAIKLVRSFGYRGELQVLQHGVDGARFSDSTPEDTSQPCIDVTFLGALRPPKNVDIFLDSLALLGQRGMRPTAVVIGDGPLRSSLETQAADLNLSQLQFVGFQSNPETWLRRTKVLVIPSEWEGLPFALVEAMRCGVVPVSTPVGSIPELVRPNETGLLLSEVSPKALASALGELLGDTRLLSRLSMGAVEATRSLTYDAVSKAWREWLQAPPFGLGVSSAVEER